MELRHWEYSFILHTCRLGDGVRKATNPFTGAPVEFPIDEGLTASERQAIRRLFATHGFQGPEPEYEGYALYLPANGSLRFRSGLDIESADGPPVTAFDVGIVVEQLSDDLLAILLDVARQGNMALMSSTGDRVRLVDQPVDPRINKRWPGAAMIRTTDALREWIEKEIGGRKVLRP